jgi:hypothetical protein
MEFTKITSFIDLDSTAAEKEAFIKQIEDIIAKIKNVGALQVKLEGAQTSKEVVAAMGEVAKAQQTLTDKVKAAERAILDKAKADKLASQIAKENAAAQKNQASAANENAKATLNSAKATTESAKTKLLEQKYTAALTKEKEKLEKASASEMKQTEKLNNAYEQLKFQYNLTANTAKRLGAEFGVNSSEFKEASAAAQAYYLKLVQLEDAVGQSQRKVGQYTNATFALNQVLREAPSFINSMQTGFLAISNNLPILSDEFAKLRTATGSNAKAFGVLFRSLFTAQTAVVVAITLLTAFGKQIGEMISSLFRGSTALDQFKKSQETLNKAFNDTSYKDAIKNVSELRINIDLAKRGFLDKEKVLKQYNETLGKTIGKADSLNEAEQLLVKNGDAYIKMTLFKAAANLALEDAAKKAIEGELAFVKGQRLVGEELKTQQENAKKNKELAQQGAPGFGGFESFITDPKKRQQVVEQAKKENQKEVDVLTKIAQDFQEQAAKIFKTAGFADFFNGQFDDKDKNKKLEDFKKEAEKNAAERLKILNDITRTKLQGEAAEILDFATNEKNSFRRREEAYQAYYDKILELARFNRKAEIEELDAKTAEELRQVQEKLKQKDLTAAQEKDLQDVIVSINNKAAAEKLLIEAKYNEDVLKLNRDSEDQLTEFYKKNLEDRAKYRLEYLKKLAEELQKELKLNQDYLATDRDKELLALNEQLKKQEISVKEYNKRKLEISKKYAQEDLDQQILYYEKLLRATARTEEERAEIEAKLAELRLKKDNEITDAKINNIKRVNDAAKQLAQEALDTTAAIISGRYELEKNKIQETIDALEAKKQKDIEVANSQYTNATERAAAIAVIEARAAAQREQLERRKRQIDQERARFERLVEIGRIIGQTAVGVVNALSGPPPAPPNPGLAAIIGAIGALQLARVLATPLPKYAEGLENSPFDHLGIVGDGGRREFMKFPDGSGWITPDRPTLAFVPQGAQIFSSLDEAGMVGRTLAPGFATPIASNGMAGYTQTLKREMKLTRQALKDKREHHFTFRQNEIHMVTKDGYNETHYLNQNLSF